MTMTNGSDWVTFTKTGKGLVKVTNSKCDPPWTQTKAATRDSVARLTKAGWKIK